MSVYAQVVLLETTRQYDSLYSYKIPEKFLHADGNPLSAIGMVVTVPFGKKNILRTAVVKEVSTELPQGVKKTKEIANMRADIMPLSTVSLACAEFMKQNYLCTEGEALKCFMPKSILDAGVQKVKWLRLAIGKDEATELLNDNTLRSIKQIRVLELLLHYGELPQKDLIYEAGISAGITATMKKKGLIEAFEKELDRYGAAVKENDGSSEDANILESPKLNEAQIKAASEMYAILDGHRYEEILLHGVTGSGKTEVYMAALARCLAQGRQGIILVPEISLTPQMEKRFTAVFGSKLAVMHSSISDKERAIRWKKMQTGEISICLGPRSALFAPFTNIGLIVVDEEHESSYRSEQNPRYEVTEIARIIAKMSCALLVAGSATPSVISYNRALSGKSRLIKLNSRAMDRPLPDINILDMRKVEKKGEIAVPLAEAIRQNITQGHQSMILLNKRGYSRSIVCGECGKLMKCPRCSVAMNLHMSERRMICHYCGYTVNAMQKCPFCGAAKMENIGCGTQKIEEALKSMFPGNPVIRLDSDTTTYKHTHKDILDEFLAYKSSILIGTQMISKGHDFHNVTLVGILGTDSILNSDSYSGSEKAFQIMMQTAGRAGRGEFAGRVFVQTYTPENFCMEALVHHSYEEFYREETAVRKQLEYPPFGEICTLTFHGSDDRAVYDAALNFKNKYLMPMAANTLSTDANKLQNGSLVLNGPIRASVAKLNGQYRWRIVARTNVQGKNKIFCHLMEQPFDAFNVSAESKTKGIRLSLDFNPDGVI